MLILDDIRHSSILPLSPWTGTLQNTAEYGNLHLLVMRITHGLCEGISTPYLKGHVTFVMTAVRL